MQSIKKDSEVEVSSEDDGFKDAWYRAILLENPTKSGRKKLLVRYTTLVEVDNSNLLTETVEQRFIRPVPPEDSDKDVEFIEGSIVDADLKDGWWTGVVIKKLEQDKFFVYFDYPPDVIQFEKKQLRTHFDWFGSKWVRSQNKELSKSEYRSGTYVEVSRVIDEIEVVWVPALIVKEEDGEKKFRVKCCNKDLSFIDDDAKSNITVDLCNVRPLPPSFFVKEYELLDRVDAFSGLGWRQGIVRWILSNKRYKVGFEVTKDELVFEHSDLRPSKEWENGSWHQGSKRNLDKKSRLDGKRKMSVALDTTLRNDVITPRRNTRRTKRKPSYVEDTETDNERETELGEDVSRMELVLAPESGNQTANDVTDDDATPIIIPQAIPIETEPKTQEKTSHEKTIRPLRIKNGLGIDSTREKMSTEHKIKEYTRKRKRGQKLDSNLNEAGKDCNVSNALITDTSDDKYDDDDTLPLSAWILRGKLSKLSLAPTSVDDETRANEDTTMVLPFAKQSPLWKVFEAMEIFKTFKHSPHFIPLLDTREEFREGSAIGEMVKYSSLIERVNNVQIQTPKSTLESWKECFLELEKYGFEVTTPISRIDMLIHLKDKQVSKEEELKDHERQITEEGIKSEKVEEELREVELKILELQSREADLIEKKEASEKEIARTQQLVSTLDKNIQDVELEYQSIVSAPW
ncbi:hypothetical protein AALP_AA4G264200 [Arabis alpina]|uniref:Agenet domain-containing protein n=1 Tax=Arabis alpina TaxID=50452 RepID=A0A087H5T9_ARAAL|nr:hypothetical protein AALP_AA4G264200 [Arabis alpina]